MNYFEKRRLRKSAREMLRHTRHVVNMREDIMNPADLDALRAGERSLAEALKADQPESIAQTRDNLYKLVAAQTPVRPFAGLRENVEVFAVAIAVAMAFRTYFLQPFKIPTGSMEPTLKGIQLQSDYTPGVLDRFPLKLGKWLVTGDWYSEVRAKADGYVTVDTLHSSPGSTTTQYLVGGKTHSVPSRARLRVFPGQQVTKGTLLWSGVKTAGDHVLVDKVSWNFRRPRRGEVMVFRTDGIAALQQGTHYIKRMCGLPNESISIHPPHLIVNGEPVSGIFGIDRVTTKRPEYAGYTLVDSRAMSQDLCLLVSTNDVVKLHSDEYLALGDNTMNSRDSRYWGPVPQKNLVGPGWALYWPFSRRWGWIR